MKTQLYTIKTLTNLHVGTGDINFDIIDNQVQRDRDEDGLPIIRSSSLKGALREHFGETKATRYIFGPANNENTQQTGAYTFFEARVLSRPVRSDSVPYLNAVSKETLRAFKQTIEDFGIETNDSGLLDEIDALLSTPIPESSVVYFGDDIGTIKIEGLSAVHNAALRPSNLSQIIGSPVALFDDMSYRKLQLPVIARNYLSNGISKNLWYEEVVPSGTLFYFVLGRAENISEMDQNDISKYGRQFDDKLSDIVQIGANASIGYGYTKIQLRYPADTPDEEARDE